MTVNCDRCGTAFDPYREPPTAGADTGRCPACGNKHDVGPATETRGRLAADSGAPGATVEIIAEEGSNIIVNPDPDEQRS